MTAVPSVPRPPGSRRDIVLGGALLLIAVVCAAAPLSLLLVGGTWLHLTLLGAVPTMLVGTALRLLLGRSAWVPLLQLVVIAAQVGLLEAWSGLLAPGAGVAGMIRVQGEVLASAAEQIALGIAPLSLDARAAILVVLLVALIVLCLELMVQDLGWHTAAGVVLWCFALLPVLQYPAGVPWWAVAGPTLGALLVLSGRAVLGPGFGAGAPPRRAVRIGASSPELPAVRTGLAAAVVILLVLSLTAPLAGVLPRTVPARTALSVDQVNAWRGAPGSGAGAVMVDDDVSVRRSLLEQDTRQVLRLETTAEDPSYLRLRTLTRFDGERYLDDPARTPRMPAAFSDARGDDASGQDPETLEQYEILLSDLTTDRLPVPENVRGLGVVGGAGGQRVDATVMAEDGEVAVGSGTRDLSGLSYRVEAEPNPATAEQLRAVGAEELAGPVEAGYVGAEEVPVAAADLADRLASEADATTAYDTALAYQEHFRSEFDYSLTATTSAGQDPLESFLAERVGYCEQFAATFALMMLSQGYPARVAIGFTPGRTEGEDRVVTTDNAHAWPEVWFGPEHGWVRFEPTPAAADNGVSAPAWAAEDEETTAAAEETPEAAPKDEPTEPAEETPTTSDPTGTPTDAVEGSAPATGPRGGVVLAGLALLLIAAAAALLRWRGRAREAARRSRWDALEAEPPGDAADRERRRRAAGELAWQDLDASLRARTRAQTWLGWTGRWGRPPLALHRDPALPPRQALNDLLDQAAAGRTEVTGEHRAAAARLADAVAAARYAPPPTPGEGGADPDSAVGALREDSDALRRLIGAAR